jgi:hypothetical protein
LSTKYSSEQPELKPVGTIGLVFGRAITVKIMGHPQYLLTDFKLSSPSNNEAKVSTLSLQQGEKRMFRRSKEEKQHTPEGYRNAYNSKE